MLIGSFALGEQMSDVNTLLNTVAVAEMTRRSLNPDCHAGRKGAHGHHAHGGSTFELLFPFPEKGENRLCQMFIVSVKQPDVVMQMVFINFPHKLQ